MGTATDGDGGGDADEGAADRADHRRHQAAAAGQEGAGRLQFEGRATKKYGNRIGPQGIG
jgi:hypothetical protein